MILTKKQEDLLNRIVGDLEELYATVSPTDFEMKEMVYKTLDKATDISSVGVYVENDDERA